jgi:DNA-binding transcriptional regulator YdaS (Cro superfamily)
MELNKWLQEELKRNPKHTKKWFADKIGLHTTSLSRHLTGERGWNDNGVIGEVCKVTNGEVTIADLNPTLHKEIMLLIKIGEEMKK